nr:hypothetical transcript [Hymenolepis microstoma]
MEIGKQSNPMPVCSSFARHVCSTRASVRSPSIDVYDSDRDLFPSSSSLRLGDIDEGRGERVLQVTQDRISPSWVPHNTQLFDENENDDGLNPPHFRRYYTLVIRNYAKVPTHISCLYVEHDSHMHVVLHATYNVGRKVNRLLTDCGVAQNEWFRVKSTRQLVRNLNFLLQYLKGRGVVKEVGVEMRDEWETARDMPPVEQPMPCSSDMRRARIRAARNWKTEQKNQKYHNLLEELCIRQVRSFDEAFHKFSPDEITFLNSSIGIQWLQVAKQQIQALNNERLAKEMTNTYLQNLNELPHECHVKHRRDIVLGATWLRTMFNANSIDIGALLGDVVQIMDKKTAKINTLCFQGQTNTGKTLLANLITSHLLIGTVCRRGDQTAFHFDNLLNRTVALMEEPRITIGAKNDYKCLLGGDRFEVDVKYGARQFLARMPVIATTNEDLGVLLPPIDQAALYSRVKQYALNEQISSELISGTIPRCSVTLCACHLIELFRKHGFYGHTATATETAVPPLYDEDDEVVIIDDTPTK